MMMNSFSNVATLCCTQIFTSKAGWFIYKYIQIAPAIALFWSTWFPTLICQRQILIILWLKHHRTSSHWRLNSHPQTEKQQHAFWLPEAKPTRLCLWAHLKVAVVLQLPVTYLRGVKGHWWIELQTRSFSQVGLASWWEVLILGYSLYRSGPPL